MNGSRSEASAETVSEPTFIIFYAHNLATRVREHADFLSVIT